VRNGTKAFVSIVSLGVVAAGYQVGQAVEVSTFASAVAPSQVGTAAPVATETETAAPVAETPVETPTETASASSANPVSPVSKPTTAPVAPAPAAPAPKATTPAASNSGGTTKDGSAVPYRFGTVQVSVTKSAGKITAVNLLQAGATGGRESAFSYLVDLAIQANGTSFGNLGGATYTVDAFKQSLESALAKF
jgi:uncharacterized protein with FMN-binding domain